MKRMEIYRHCEFIADVVSEYPEGIGVASLQRTLFARCGSVSRRTLQRRLESLTRDGRITTEGRGVARVYKFRAPDRAPERRAEEPGAYYDSEIVHVPVSREGEEIRAEIRKPLSLRRQIGYDQKFLDDYEPGVNRYLPEQILSRLHEIGRTPEVGKPAGACARNILERLRVDFAWASSRLEGCTYTRPEAELLIVSGRPAPGRHALETRMVFNHKAAIMMLAGNADKIGFDALTLRNLHAVLSSGFHRRSIEIPGAVFSPPLMPRFIEERFLLLIEKADAISDPFEQAFFVMVQLAYLQPFADANKPVSRLAANIPLFRHNFYPLSFIDVPEPAYTEGTLGVHELGRIELLRDVFVWAYERSCLRYRKAQ